MSPQALVYIHFILLTYVPEQYVCHVLQISPINDVARITAHR